LYTNITIPDKKLESIASYIPSVKACESLTVNQCYKHAVHWRLDLDYSENTPFTFSPECSVCFTCYVFMWCIVQLNWPGSDIFSTDLCRLNYWSMKEKRRSYLKIELRASWKLYYW